MSRSDVKVRHSVGEASCFPKQVARKHHSLGQNSAAIHPKIRCRWSDGQLSLQRGKEALRTDTIIDAAGLTAILPTIWKFSRCLKDHF